MEVYEKLFAFCTFLQAGKQILKASKLVLENIDLKGVSKIH